MAKVLTAIRQQMSAPFSPLNVLTFIIIIALAVMWLPQYITALME